MHNSRQAPIRRKTIRLISNLRRLDGIATDQYQALNTFIGDGSILRSSVCLFFKAFRHDAVVVCSLTRLLLVFCVLRWLFPMQRCKVIAVDYILPEPRGLKQKLVARLKGMLLRKVDMFILHFPDTLGYERHYGIPRAHCVFVPFKVNYADSILPVDQLSSEGEYVFTAGRTFRDIPTFLSAMKQVGYPGFLLYEDTGLMKEAGTEFDLRDVPSNLKIEKNVGEKSWLEYIARAKIVVIPLLPRSGYAPGLSLYLMAMAMKKCVIITEGLSTRGILTNQAIIVPPEDPMALAEAIRRVWNDAELRERVAAAGQRYASGLAGEARLLGDTVNICGRLVEGKEEEVEQTVVTRA
ncbi:MAG: glycosyltransferase [Nitrososphaera sp.]|nr:glycosyltransferase [Nitrososphaera sp.]